MTNLIKFLSKFPSRKNLKDGGIRSHSEVFQDKQMQERKKKI